MNRMVAVSLIAAFFAGLACIASPCCFPLIPGVMAYATERNRLTPAVIALGISMAFTILGVVSAVIGIIFYEYLPYVRILSGMAIAAMGLIMLIGPAMNAFPSCCRIPTIYRLEPKRPGAEGPLGGLILGVGLGILWMPCTGPILAAILMSVARQGNTAYGGLLLLAYSVGFAIPLVFLARSSGALSGKLRGVFGRSSAIKMLPGAILVAVGLYFLYANGLFRLLF